MFGFKKEKSKAYLCSRWPVLDLTIKPHPTKDRNGVTEGAGHHVLFKDGRYSTENQEEIDFIENHEYFRNGTIVDEHVWQAKDIASKKAKLDREAEGIGYKLVKI